MDNPTLRLLVILVLFFAVISTASVTYMVAGGGSDSGGESIDKSQVEKIVFEVLKSNPEVIVNAFNASRQEQETADSAKAQQAISERTEELNNDPGTPFVGNANADVVIVEFFDYNCGYCKKITPDLLKLLEGDKNIKIVLKDFPILGPQSVENTKAGLAAYKIDKDKFLDFHIALLKNTPRNNGQLFALAEKNGIDSKELEKEMESNSVLEQVRQNMALADAIGVRGTPSLVINGQYIRGAVGYEQLKQMVDSVRNKG